MNRKAIRELQDRLGRMTPEERDRELTSIAMCWDSDWPVLRDIYLYCSENLTIEQIGVKCAEYYGNCRRILVEEFGYTPWF